MLRTSCFAGIPEFERMVLLVRHAERTEITDMRNQAEARLTDQGMIDATLFGHALGASFGPIEMWHSPIPRCRQTADAITGGVERNGGTVRLEGELGWLSGDFVDIDPGWANEQVRTIGAGSFMRKWFDGDYPGDMISSLDAAAVAQMKFVLRQLEHSDSPVIVDVTHDWNLMFLREYYLNLRHEQVGMPPFLDMVALLQRNGRSWLWALGRTAEVNRGEAGSAG